MKFKKMDEISVNSVLQSFSFLEKDCNYQRSEGYRQSNAIYSRRNYVITYINKIIQKQVEIALLLNDSNVEIEIARFDEDGFLKYDDKNYYISHYQLYHLLEPPVFESDFYMACLRNRAQAIHSAGAMIRGFENILCSDNWFDIDKLNQIYAEYYYKKWKIDVNSTDRVEPVADVIRRKLLFLTKKGYQLKQDSNNMPFYERNGWFTIYTNGIKDVAVFQSDMRDYMYYYIDIAGIKSELNYSDYNSSEKFADHILHLIEKHL